MNKSDLIELVAYDNGCSVLAAKAIVSEIFSGMTDTLVAGGRVEIRGFGSFAIKGYESYAGKNPRTGVRIVVAAKKVPFFKVGKELRERILEVKQVRHARKPGLKSGGNK